MITQVETEHTLTPTVQEQDGHIKTALRGMQLLDEPSINKGTAFTEEERTQLCLHGLLPPHVETLDQQVVRAYEAYQRKTDDLERHIYLRALQDTNEVLFYRLLVDHTEEMMPLVYTPVVAQGCAQFSHIYRRPRGLFVSYPRRNSIPTLLQNRPNREVDVIVVTDGERILGIGDQGVGGMGIPIGKLSLYTLIGGIHPSRTLPIVLDVGTNNQERLRDPEYLGWPHERITGQAYSDFIDQFVQAVKRELPDTCLQWEDFSMAQARPILQRYRDELLTFNDDIQGTAAVALGAILSAVKVTKKNLKDQQVVILGAGSASIGVADYLRETMVAEGLSDQEARRRFWIVNRGGLLLESRVDISADQRIYAQPDERVTGWPHTLNGKIGLADVIGKVDAGILLGLSTLGGAFTEPIITEMASKVERPVIFPLSNPTVNSEAIPTDLIRWTEGRALVATGSPFAPVSLGGTTFQIAQCNNVFIFPAVGLGIVASRARRVTDGMMIVAARTLALHAPNLAQHAPTVPDGTCSLLPPVSSLRDVALKIAFAVGREAQNAGVAPKTTQDELQRRVIASRWEPDYPVFVE